MLPYFRFSTDSVAPLERFSYWHDTFEPWLDIMPDPKVPPRQFRQRIEAFRMSDVLFLKNESSAKYYKSRYPRRNITTGNSFLLRYFITGTYLGENDGRAIQVRPGDICLLNMTRSVDLHISNSRSLSIAIPRSALTHRALRANLEHGRVLKKSSPVTQVLTHHLVTTWNQLAGLERGEVEATEHMLLACVAAAFASNRGVEGGDKAPLKKYDLQAIRAYIQDHLTEDITVSHLCQQFGYSRSALYRLFQPLGGIASYIQRLRLHRCMETLTRGEYSRLRIIDIANYWGFTNHSHFSRVFREEFGVTPSDATEWAEASKQKTSRTDAGEGLSFLFDWVDDVNREFGPTEK